MKWNDKQLHFLSEFKLFLKDPTRKVYTLTGGPGTGKCQPLDADIFTTTGVKKMRQIRLGDELIGSNGAKCYVNGIFKKGRKKVFEVHFDDGSIVECCDEHLWAVNTRSRRKRGDYSLKVIELKDMIGKEKLANNRKNFSIPFIAPIQFKERKTSIDPYLLGLLLGDGCLSTRNITFSNIEEDVLKYVSKFSTLSKRSEKDFYLANCKELKDELQKYNLIGTKSDTKFIPTEFQVNTQEVRLSVLQGLLDTDGHIKSNSIDYVTTSKKLSEGVKFLVETLGGRCVTSEKLPTFTHKGEKRTGKIAYRSYIRFGNGIVPIRSKKNLEKYSTKKQFNSRFITEIRETDKVKEMQCISVSANDSLYVTNNCILTHNTTVLQAALPSYKRVVGATVSHAAKNILQDSLGGGVKCYTIAKLLGLKMEITSEGEIEFKPDPNAIITPITQADLLIIDECSMINKDIHKMIINMSNKDAKVVFVGDGNQLPSVGEEADSITLSYEGVELNQPMRFTGNIHNLTSAIKKEIEKVKSGIAPNRHIINYTTKGRSEDMIDPDGISGVRFLNNINETLDIAVTAFQNAKSPNAMRLLAFKNATIDALNNMIRYRLYGETPAQFEKGELVISNGGYKAEFNNGEVFRIRDLKRAEHRHTPCLAVKLSIDTKEPVYVISNDPSDPGNIKYYNTLRKLANEAKSTFDPGMRKRIWTMYYDYKMSFAKFDYAYAQNC